MRPEVLVATRSAGKLAELAPLLSSFGYAACSLADLGIAESAAEAGIECHETFLENARAKARYFAPMAGGRPVLAEDSGLEVDALAGAPGVRSRRWSGREDLAGEALDAANNALLLSLLRGEANRQARYVCAAVWHDRGREVSAVGACEGRILEVGRGAAGFGYDPLFYSADLGQAFGEATREAKEGVSHRGRAVRALLGRVPVGR